VFNKKDAVELCPLLKSACIERRCKFWVHLLGNDPQTGQPVDKWDCSFRFFPMLLIENAQQTRQAGAAVESLRNEMTVGQRTLSAALMGLISVAEQARSLPATHGDRVISGDGQENNT